MIKIINLYGESEGIEIMVDQFGNWTNETAAEAERFGDTLTRVVGHALYACSADEAAHSIAREYRMNHQPLCSHCGFSTGIGGHNTKTGCSNRVADRS
jgi:hypothetical protein